MFDPDAFRKGKTMSDRTPDEIDAIVADLCNDGQCPFCGHDMDSRSLFPDCDDEEVYCPECGYVEGIS